MLLFLFVCRIPEIERGHEVADIGIFLNEQERERERETKKTRKLTLQMLHFSYSPKEITQLFFPHIENGRTQTKNKTQKNKL